MSNPTPIDQSLDLEKLLDDYDRHLKEVRGLACETCKAYRWSAQRFLDWLRKRAEAGQSIEFNFPSSHVLDFVTEQLEAHAGFSRSWRHRLSSETRSFLRFLYWRDLVNQDLARLVPTIPGYRLSSIPRHLSWDQVRQILDCVDVSEPVGKRDKALIAALALLGLRNREVRTLQLDQIAWRAGEIRLPQTKAGRERVLPLPNEVGRLLTDYILHGRPRNDLPQVFLRHKPPIGSISDRHTIAWIVRKRIRLAGIDAPFRQGAYLLRHSLATRLVNVPVSIKDIADVLGHASIDTTAIYTKVATASLCKVALRFPGGAV